MNGERGNDGWQLLSSDELAAIVDELSSARREEERARRLPGLEPDEGAERGRQATVRRVLERFARDEARVLASRFQRRMEVRLLTLEELRPSDAAALLLASDRLVGFAVPPTGEPGFVLVSRPLLFAWLRQAFGTRGTAPAPVPERPYTQIELRFLRRVAAELIERLAAAAGAPLEASGVDGPAALRAVRAGRLLVASFELSGFEEVGRLRLLLPRAAFAESAAPERRPAASAGSATAYAVLDAPVRLSVRVGEAELTLAALAALRVGQVIPVAARRDGSVLAHVEGAARFRALRGTVEGRLAVQIVERLADEEDGVDGRVAAS